MSKPEATTPEERAQRRTKARTDMMWHLAAFVILNIFLWSLDIFTGGTTWAFWITAGWGIGLAFHRPATSSKNEPRDAPTSDASPRSTSGSPERSTK